MAVKQQPTTPREVADRIIGYQKPRGDHAESLLSLLDDELDGLDEVKELLDEYNSIEKHDFENDLDGYRDARTEAWEAFTSALDEFADSVGSEDEEEEDDEEEEEDAEALAAERARIADEAKRSIRKQQEDSAARQSEQNRRAIEDAVKAVGEELTRKSAKPRKVVEENDEPQPRAKSKRVGKETVITMDSNSDEAEVYTKDVSVVKRLMRLGYEPDSEDDTSSTFRVPSETVQFVNAATGGMRATRNGKLKKVSTMSDANRLAAGVRMRTGRARKLTETFGVEIRPEQVLEFHLRPGQMPTRADVKRVTGKMPKQGPK